MRAYEVQPAPAYRLLAQELAGRAAAELDIAAPRLRFFVKSSAPTAWPVAWESDRALAGLVDWERAGEVWIAVGLSAFDLAVTIGHEAHHVRYGARTGIYESRSSPTPGEQPAMERAAEAYGFDFSRRHHHRIARS